MSGDGAKGYSVDDVVVGSGCASVVAMLIWKKASEPGSGSEIEDARYICTYVCFHGNLVMSYCDNGSVLEADQRMKSIERVGIDDEPRLAQFSRIMRRRDSIQCQGCTMPYWDFGNKVDLEVDNDEGSGSPPCSTHKTHICNPTTLHHSFDILYRTPPPFLVLS